MTYNLDTIPAKIYFKILENGDTSLLSRDKNVDTDKLWDLILKETNDKTTKQDKFLQISKKMQELSTKLVAVKNAISYLKHQKDDELMEMLHTFGYRIDEDTLDQDLERIERESNVLEVKIGKYEKDLERLQPKKKVTFEDLFMSYLAITGIGFSDANSITYLEFKGLEKQVKSKINALNGRKRKNNRR